MGAKEGEVGDADSEEAAEESRFGVLLAEGDVSAVIEVAAGALTIPVLLDSLADDAAAWAEGSTDDAATEEIPSPDPCLLNGPLIRPIWSTCFFSKAYILSHSAILVFSSRLCGRLGPASGMDNHMGSLLLSSRLRCRFDLPLGEVAYVPSRDRSIGMVLYAQSVHTMQST
jgi:hypothetical protein